MAMAIKDKDPDFTLLPQTVSPFIKELITQLLDKNPLTRPDAQSLLEKQEMQVYISQILSLVSVSDKSAAE